jgi:hypothetical protein
MKLADAAGIKLLWITLALGCLSHQLTLWPRLTYRTGFDLPSDQTQNGALEWSAITTVVQFKIRHPKDSDCYACCDNSFHRKFPAMPTRSLGSLFLHPKLTPHLTASRVRLFKPDRGTIFGGSGLIA